MTFRGGRHVADPATSPTTSSPATGPTSARPARAIERTYQPCQLNRGTFGNAVPHVQTHIAPRYPDDPAPGRPLPDWVFQNAPTLNPQQLANQIEQLRHYLPASET